MTETVRSRNIYTLHQLGKTFAEIGKLYNIHRSTAHMEYHKQARRESAKRLKFVEGRYKTSGMTTHILSDNHEKDLWFNWDAVDTEKEIAANEFGTDYSSSRSLFWPR